MSKVYVVRQPIFDDRNEVVAYELLFHRPSGGDAASDREMTSQVIANSIVNIGLGELTGNKPAYINFSRDLLMDDTALLLPPDRVGIEVLETVEIDDALALEAQYAARLRTAGDFELDLAFERRHFDFASQRRLRKADRHFDYDVVVLADEQVVLLDVDDNVQVARRTAVDTRIAFSRHAHTRTCINPRWDSHLK